jgi:hypothetical protein
LVLFLRKIVNFLSQMHLQNFKLTPPRRRLRSNNFLEFFGLFAHDPTHCAVAGRQLKAYVLGLRPA